MKTRQPPLLPSLPPSSSQSLSSLPPSSSYYTVPLLPDPVYGLGMRLEKRDHFIHVASFKRHPQTGALLPAEASAAKAREGGREGGIGVGDALVAVNGYSLAGMELEQAVGVMRSVGGGKGGREGGREGGGVGGQGEVTLRFKRSVPPGGVGGGGGGEGGRVSRVPSILDFSGHGKHQRQQQQLLQQQQQQHQQQQQQQQQPHLPSLSPIPPPSRPAHDHRAGFLWQWQQKGHGALPPSLPRLDSATLLALPEDEEGKEGRREEGVRPPKRVAVLIGCAGARLWALEIILFPPSPTEGGREGRQGEGWK